MKRKTRKILFISLIFVCIMALVSCGKAFEFKDYTYNTNLTSLLPEKDSDMAIDGLLNEEKWQSQQMQTHKFAEVNMKVTTIFTEKGLYVGVIIKDKRVFHKQDYQMDKNTNVTLNIIPSNLYAQNVFNFTSPFKIQIDTKHTRPFGVFNFISAVTVQGAPVNTGKSEGMTLEIFLPWSEIELDEKPETIGMIAEYNLVTGIGTSASARYVTPGNSSVNQSAQYYLFDGNGYINLDKENAFLGDSIEGLSKTADWDLTNLENGIIKTNPTGQKISTNGNQYIFFKDLKAVSYRITTTIKTSLNDCGIADPLPKVGILTGYNEYGRAALLLDVRAQYLQENRVVLKRLNLFSGWDMISDANAYIDSTVTSYNYAEGVPITIIKDDDKLYYFLGNRNNLQLVATETQNSLKGETVAGLYSIGADIEYADFDYEIYDNNKDELDKLFESQHLARINLSSSSGGTITTDKLAINKGESAKIKISTDNYVFELSSFLVQFGKNKSIEYKDIIDRDMINGEYVFNNILNDINIDATFSRVKDFGLATANLLFEVPVTVPNITINVQGLKKSHKYTIKFDSENLRIQLPYDIYELEFNVGGFRKIVLTNIEFSDKKIELGDLSFIKSKVGGSSFINNREYSSSNKFDYSNEWKGEVFADETLTTEDIAYFTDQANANFKATITVTNLGGKDNDSTAGFILQMNGNAYRFYILESGLRIYNTWDARVNQRNLGANYNFREKNACVTLTIIKTGNNIKIYANRAIEGQKYATQLLLESKDGIFITENISKPITVYEGITVCGFSKSSNNILFTNFDYEILD